MQCYQVEELQGEGEEFRGRLYCGGFITNISFLETSGEDTELLHPIEEVCEMTGHAGMILGVLYFVVVRKRAERNQTNQNVRWKGEQT